MTKSLFKSLESSPSWWFYKGQLGETQENWNKSFISKKGLICVENWKILLISISHMVSCNLRKSLWNLVQVYHFCIALFRWSQENSNKSFLSKKIEDGNLNILSISYDFLLFSESLFRSLESSPVLCFNSIIE